MTNNRNTPGEFTEDHAFLLLISVLALCSPVIIVGICSTDAMWRDGQFGMFAFPLLLFLAGCLPLGVLAEAAVLLSALRKKAVPIVLVASIGLTANWLVWIGMRHYFRSH